MDAAALNRYLHEHIPLAAAMQLQVTHADGQRIRVAAPLAANRNPHGTVFGGSLATLAIVSGWTLLYDALQRAGLPASLVIQHFDADYRAPAAAEFSAESELPEQWPDFLQTLQKRGRARLDLAIRLSCDDRQVLHARAVYAAQLPSQQR